MRCVGLGACWAFGMAWNVVRGLGECFCEWRGTLGVKGGLSV
ncbi:hypothetical protein [Bartonella sp. CM120XJJH]